MRGSELLNADTIFGGVSTLFSEEKPSGGSRLGKGKEPAALDWIESDTDAQLMLFVPFQSTIKLHSIEMTSFAKHDEDDDDEVPARPRRVELYTNRAHNLGFEEAEDTPAVQTVELTASSWREEGAAARRPSSRRASSSSRTSAAWSCSSSTRSTAPSGRASTACGSWASWARRSSWGSCRRWARRSDTRLCTLFPAALVGDEQYQTPENMR